MPVVQPDPAGAEPLRRRLERWFTVPPGSYLHELERSALASVLPDLFGYHIMQVGRIGGGGLLESSRIAHRVTVDIGEAGEGPAIVCLPEALPVAADSIDVLVLPHVLEFSENPHRVLREAERVLIGEGHLLLLGFSPWSLLGAWRPFLAWRDDPPWCGHFYGLSRIRDWLTLLDLELVTYRRLFYRPPLRHARVMDRLAFLEKLGSHAWPFLGGVYMLLAKKRVVPLTPVKLRWRARRGMIASGLAEPTARAGIADT